MGKTESSLNNSQQNAFRKRRKGEGIQTLYQAL